eukprot:2471323-Alexandrium_andersonii.AAC.1
MAHRVGCALLDRANPAEGRAQAYGETAIAREFRRRQVVGHDWPDQEQAWNTLPFPLLDDYKYLNIQKVDLASIRTSEALSAVDLQESIERLKEGHAPGGPR